MEAGIDLEDTLNWSYWAKRKKGRWSDEQIRDYVQYRLDFTRDMILKARREVEQLDFHLSTPFASVR